MIIFKKTYLCRIFLIPSYVNYLKQYQEVIQVWYDLIPKYFNHFLNARKKSKNDHLLEIFLKNICALSEY